jgi:hypothetical protein
VGQTEVWTEDLGIPWVTWLRTARSVGCADTWSLEAQQRERQIMEQAMMLEEGAIVHLQDTLARISG